MTKNIFSRERTYNQRQVIDIIERWFTSSLSRLDEIKTKDNEIWIPLLKDMLEIQYISLKQLFEFEGKL